MSLYYNYWPADSTSAPCAIYLHGLESHAGWFLNLAERLNSRGINVYAFDRRGSGLNKPNCKNFCARYILDDVETFVKLVKEEHPGSRIFLIGLCLGGKIAAAYAASRQRTLDGLILISPSFKSRLKFPIKDALRILLRPNSMIKVPIEDRMFTSNEKYLQHIKHDPLRLRYVPAQHLMEIVKLGRLVGDARDGLRIPLLVMLAGIDSIIDTRWVRRWYEKVRSEDKTLKTYKDFWHILTFEEDADTVIDDAAEWILRRSDA
jgi:alpha-beta hydrolase superfamily lysophospholipase